MIWCWAAVASTVVSSPEWEATRADSGDRSGGHRVGLGTEAKPEGTNHRGTARRIGAGPDSCSAPLRTASDQVRSPRHTTTRRAPTSCSGPAGRGGTVGLVSWTPDGFIGQMFATMKPYAPPPPPGAQAPPLWGNEEHVRALFRDRLADIVARRQTIHIDRFATPEDFRAYFKARYGPTIVAYRVIANDPSGSPLSTATSPSSRGVTTTVRRRPSWTGSTCCSPAANAAGRGGIPGDQDEDRRTPQVVLHSVLRSIHG